MNERMLELYKQAHVPDTTIDPSNNMPYETMCFSAERFAELIVRECTAQIAEAIPDTYCSASGAYKTAKIAAMTRVKAHFGVEE
jgi:hypothetical protein